MSPRALLCVLAAVLSCGGAGARAGVNGRTRLHKVDKIAARLSQTTRQRADAVTDFWSPEGAGTASLVYRSPDGRSGLILTNFHVARKLPSQSLVELGGVKGQVTDWIAGAAHVDYALMKVKFEAPLPATITPLALTHQAPQPHAPLYTVGYPGIAMLYLQLDEGPAAGPFTHFDRTAIDRELDAEPGRVKIINMGHEVGGGAIREYHDPDPRPEHREKVPRLSFTTNLQTLPGGSGSPVFSTVNHRMIGLVWTGGKSHPAKLTHWNDAAWAWAEGGIAVPSLHILSDLEAKHARGELDAHAGAIDDLLRRSAD